eukprot:1806967-Pleurochrysis_carterae.AAC.1
MRTTGARRRRCTAADEAGVVGRAGAASSRDSDRDGPSHGQGPPRRGAGASGARRGHAGPDRRAGAESTRQ